MAMPLLLPASTRIWLSPPGKRSIQPWMASRQPAANVPWSSPGRAGCTWKIFRPVIMSLLPPKITVSTARPPLLPSVDRYRAKRSPGWASGPGKGNWAQSGTIFVRRVAFQARRPAQGADAHGAHRFHLPVVYRPGSAGTFLVVFAQPASYYLSEYSLLCSIGCFFLQRPFLQEKHLSDHVLFLSLLLMLFNSFNILMEGAMQSPFQTQHPNIPPPEAVKASAQNSILPGLAKLAGCRSRRK